MDPHRNQYQLVWMALHHRLCQKRIAFNDLHDSTFFGACQLLFYRTRTAYHMELHTMREDLVTRTGFEPMLKA